MKLATLKNGTRDGRLLVVSPCDSRAVPSTTRTTLQSALDDWANTEPALRAEANALATNERADAFDLVFEDLQSPLPRAYAWIDGSAYINHIVLVRKARGAEPPATLETDPLVYQGGSDTFIGPRDDIPVADLSWGADFESEIAVITDDVPQGTTAADANKHIKLMMLCNDVSLRNLI
ncbi:MAG: fumarylacetoacetate (FAA) hydrolase, partial [Myxococcota bacterium]